ncbi:hypothetical protein ACROYT_G007947 [Oculina patagonica]
MIQGVHDPQDHNELWTIIKLEKFTLMDDFFQQVRTTTADIDKIAEDVEQVKIMQSAMLSTAVQQQGLI